MVTRINLHPPALSQEPQRGRLAPSHLHGHQDQPPPTYFVTRTPKGETCTKSPTRSQGPQGEVLHRSHLCTWSLELTSTHLLCHKDPKGGDLHQITYTSRGGGPFCSETSSAIPPFHCSSLRRGRGESFFLALAELVCNAHCQQWGIPSLWLL